MKTTQIAPILISSILLSLVFGCGEPPLANDSNEDSNDPPVNEQDPPDLDELCSQWCENMRDCAVVGYEPDDCLETCTTIYDTDFMEPCAQCLEETSCSELRADCLSPDTACYQTPSTSFIFDASEFSDDLIGRQGYGRIVTYDGHDIGAFTQSEIRAESNNLHLGFGTVLTPAMHYWLYYYVDADDDGVCDPAIDPSYFAEIKNDELSAVVYQFQEVPEQTSPEICEEFTSLPELCLSRCERLDECGSLSESVTDCRTSCEEELSPSFLNQCVPCLQDQQCSDHAQACDQTGGLCDEDRIPPETEFLLYGSQFGDYEGHTVYAFVEDMAGQILTPTLERTIEDGGFFLHFGQSVWMNQTYIIVFFIDIDGTGQCDDTDPGWALEVEVEESSLHYQFHDHTPEDEIQVCSRVP